MYFDDPYRYGVNAASETQHERNLSNASKKSISFTSLEVYPQPTYSSLLASLRSVGSSFGPGLP